MASVPSRPTEVFPQHKLKSILYIDGIAGSFLLFLCHGIHRTLSGKAVKKTFS